jgi:hypothetical protein
VITAGASIQYRVTPEDLAPAAAPAAQGEVAAAVAEQGPIAESAQPAAENPGDTERAAENAMGRAGTDDGVAPPEAAPDAAGAPDADDIVEVVDPLVDTIVASEGGR